MRANLYIGVLIGVLIFVAIMWYTNRGKVEGFVDAGAGTGTGAASGTSSSDLPADVQTLLASLNPATGLKDYKYVEKKDDIPNNGTLRLYYSSFSDKTLANDVTYIPETFRWNNHLKTDEPITIVNTSTASLLLSIKSSGLPTKDFKLNGISVPKLTDTSTLGSFSVSFYCKFNTIQFTNGTPIQVFDIPLVYPNRVRLELREVKKTDGTVDTDRVDIYMYLGETETFVADTKSRGKTKDLFIGNDILFTFVYDSEVNKIRFYLGESTDNQYEQSLGNTKPSLIYGYSGLHINKTADLDANIKAITFYNKALSFDEHTRLLSYLKQQETGVASILEAARKMSETQISAISGYLKDKTVTIEDLKKQLATCEATPKKEEEKKFKYGVKMPAGAEDVSAADLESCSILGVKKRPVTASITDATISKDATATPVPATATATPKSRFAVDIPFLKDILPKSFSTEDVTAAAPKA